VLDIREATERDREAIANLAGLAFNFVLSPEVVSLPDSLCAYDGERVVGSCRAIPLHQWFGGARVPCAGVGAVAVLPEYRGRGVGGNLMRELLERRRLQGDVVSTLYPANAQLYRKLGYDYGGLRPEFNALLTDLPPSSGEVRAMAKGDTADVMACFSRFAAGHNGPVETADPARFTDHALAHAGEGTHQRTVVVPGADGVDGYASYFLDKWDKDGYAVHCKHLVALTPSALSAVLGHFRRFENAARDIVWHGPASTGAVGLALASTGFSIVPQLRRWMLRILDVPAALEARGYPGFSGQVVIAVDDPLYPANAGPWLVQVAEGRARVSPAPGPVAGPVGAAAAGRKPLPIGLFSSLYTGLATAGDLVLVGALDQDDPRLATLAALFAGPAPWMPDFF
jgi:predicted acetyltransferase